NVTEALNYFFDHPMNLNSASEEELEDLGLLTDIQISDLILHRKLYGKFISIYELQSLKYWDLQTIQLVLPFVRVDDRLDQLHLTFKDAIEEGDFELYLRYQTIPEDKAGYADVPDSIQNTSNSYYYGNPDRYYTRFRYSYRNNISIGVTGEKDAGEEFFTGSNRNGFDFYSFHAFFKGGKYLRSVALGDYQLQIGQGLNLWSGYAFGKTADIATVKRTPAALRPYTSVDETRFLRGAAVEAGVGPVSLTLFGSMKMLDGAPEVDTLFEDTEFISSINISGLHRTNSELARKNTLTEYIGGANLRYRSRGLQFGLAGVYQGYDKEFNRDMRPDNMYDFRGRERISVSGDYGMIVKNFNFFGEAALTLDNKALAHIHGVVFSADPRLTFSLVYRDYDTAYQTFYKAGFSEGSNTQNEKGIYSGMRFKLNSAWSLTSYFDLFRFPWMRFQVDAPSEGHELMIQPSFKPNKQLEIYGRFRQQLRQRNSRNTEDFAITPIEDVLQRNYRINLSYAVSESFTVKSRLEYVTIDRPSNEPEKGMIFTQDVIWKPKNFPVDLSLRYALFDTDSYDTRIYTYENNALYVFAVPAYFYTGSRAYVMLRYSFLKHFDLWVRYGTFIYDNRETIGSGPEEIKGPRKSDITVQLRIKL
ncbi:MAG: hypothetical protein ACK45H_00295, partial [Bacteroidota bacterium]